LPKLIEHIDQIARRLKRDVLYVCFGPAEYDDWFPPDQTDHPKRLAIIAKLDALGIGWVECGPVAREDTMIGYLGDIYVDVAFDVNDRNYQIIRDLLENADGEPLDPEIRFYYLPLSKALKNAHHDEPGFWEKWAENF
jgi:hypothetical protein